MKYIYLSLLMAYYFSEASAQDSTVSKGIDSTQLRDLSDLFSKKKKAKKKKVEIAVAPDFTYLPAAGYSMQTGFAGVVTANLSFRLAKGRDAKQSTINTSFTYSQYNQTILPLMANIWSKNGKWNYIVDWRYMNYPSPTWGLAGRADPNDKSGTGNGYTINFKYWKIHQMILRALSKNVFIGTGYYFDKFNDISELGANGQPAPPDTYLKKQGLTNRDEIGIGIPFRFLLDSRINQLNPNQGWYLSVTWRDNLVSLGSKKNWQSLVIDVRKYFQITRSGNTLAFWVYSWRSAKGTPYLMLPSTGWDDSYNTGRGYIQGRFRSNIMNYMEAEYRFKITHNGLLGMVLFANVQSYKQNLVSGREVLAPAAGTGLRIKLNKNSGANLCIDYGVGQNGSQGFFVNLGEVF